MMPASNLTATERFCRWLVLGRWWLLALAALAAALAYVPAQRLAFDRSIENMFAPGDPLLTPYRQLKRTFGGNEVVLAVYVDEKLMTPAGIGRVDKLARQLEQVPGVERTFALSDTPLRSAIVVDWMPGSRQAVELLEGYAVGRDRQTAAVICFLVPETESQTPREETIGELRRRVEAHDASGVIAGEPVMVVDGFAALEADGVRLNRISTLLLMLTMVYCFRSIRWVLLPMAVVVWTLLVTKALLVVGGLRLSMVSSMLNAIVTVISIATVMHLVIRFRQSRSAGLAHREALVAAGALVAAAVFWACVTDAVGFSSLLTARVGPVQDFGLMMALGSLVVLLGVMTLVPALSLVGRIDRDPHRAWGEAALDVALARTVGVVQHWPKTLGVLSLLLAVVAVWGCFQLRVESDFTRNFRAGSPVVRSYELVENNLGGAGVWDVLIPVPENASQEFVQRVRRLEERLRSEPVVAGSDGVPEPALTKVLSLVDMADAVRLGGAETDKPLAEVRTDLARLMPGMIGTLYGEDPQTGRPWLRIMLRARERQPAEAKQQLIGQVQQISREEFPDAEVTGFYVLLANLIDSLVRDQWFTFAVATAGIAAAMLLALRSVPLALVALVPNVLPILLVSGLMGWADRLGLADLKVNMGAAMIAAVSIGLSVDSSIHYIMAFRRARRRGCTVREALDEVHQTVGRAITFSTIALVVGFSALCLSEFVPTIYFGALVSLALLGGLIGNLVVLPLLLGLVSRGRKDLAPTSQLPESA